MFLSCWQLRVTACIVLLQACSVEGETWMS